MPWGRVAAVLAGLVAAHWLLFALLTAGTGAALERIEARYGGPPGEAAAPGAAPPPESPAFAEWNARSERHGAAKEWERHARHRRLLAGGLLFSLLVQVGLTGWLVWRHARGGRRAAPARA
jgi:hypothetical protein